MINAYYIMENGQQVGPYTHTELMDRGIDAHTMVLSPLKNNWSPAMDLPEFASYFESQGFFVPEPTNMAGFWWRLLAWIIDYVFFNIFMGMLGGVVGVIVALNHISFDFDSKESNAGFGLIGICVYMSYNAIFESSKIQASLGKKICKLVVVTADGSRLTFGKALGRNLAKLISSFLCGFGFLMVLWDSNKQGWHDKIANCYVLRKEF